MAGNGGKALTIVAVSVLSWYGGLKFWKPLVVEQLKEDGALRTDIDIEVDDSQPKSWDDLKVKLKSTIHPEKEEEWIKQRNLEANLKLLEQVKQEQIQRKEEEKARKEGKQ